MTIAITSFREGQSGADRYRGHAQRGFELATQVLPTEDQHSGTPSQRHKGRSSRPL